MADPERETAQPEPGAEATERAVLDHLDRLGAAYEVAFTGMVPDGVTPSACPRACRCTSTPACWTTRG